MAQIIQHFNRVQWCPWEHCWAHPRQTFQSNTTELHCRLDWDSPKQVRKPAVVKVLNNFDAICVIYQYYIRLYFMHLSALEDFAMMGSAVQNSSHWSTMEPYFQLAYWIMAYQPNVTAPPNCEWAIKIILIFQNEIMWSPLINNN